jgi:hypothetical protein
VDRKERRLLGPFTMLLLATACWTGCAANSDSAGRKPLPCERLGFPCTLAEVAPETLRSSLALGEIVAERLAREDTGSLAHWIETQPGVVEVLHDEDTVAFRLEGARRVWLNRDLLQPRKPPSAARWAAPGAGLPSAGVLLASAVAIAPTPQQQKRRGGIVGQDTDGNGKINQRDERKALILEPDALFGDSEPGAGPPGSNEGTFIEQILEKLPAYKDRVSVRRGQAAGIDAFRHWNDYDVVHVAGRSLAHCLYDGEGEETQCSWMLATGSALARDPPDPLAEYKRDLYNLKGLEISAVSGDRPFEWRVFVTDRFFQRVYPEGVRRALIFLDARNAVDAKSIPRQLAGSGSTVVWMRDDWSDSQYVDVGEAVRENAAVHELWVPAFYDYLAAGYSALDSVLSVFCSSDGCAGFAPDIEATTDLRIREIVSLREAPGLSSSLFDEDVRFAFAQQVAPRPLLLDGMENGVLVPTATGSKLRVYTSVEGIAKADIGQVVARVELDGQPVAEHRFDSRDAKGPTTTGRYGFLFEDVPIRRRLENGAEYTLEAVATLPGGGQSRYEIRLPYHDTVVLYSGDITGGFAPQKPQPLRIWADGNSPIYAYNGSPVVGCSWQLAVLGKDGDSLLLSGMLPSLGSGVNLPQPPSGPSSIGSEVINSYGGANLKPYQVKARMLPACPLRADCRAGLPWADGRSGIVHFDTLSPDHAIGSFGVNFKENGGTTHYQVYGRFSVPVGGVVGERSKNLCLPSGGG